MKNSPLISVIVPFLNEEKFLTDAINSVLNQDYSNWEVILVDDGSTDESTRIAKEFEEKFPDKIKYHHHQDHVNKGLSPSRNVGISRSNGALIAFLDADDIWKKEKLSNQVTIFNQYPQAEMIIEASEYWYNWENEERNNQIILIGASQDKLYYPPELVFELYPLRKGDAPCPSGIIITKEAVHRSGGFEESFINEFSLYEDQAFLHKIYLNEIIYVSRSCNNLYRQHPDSIVSSVKASGKYEAVRKYFLDWLYRYVKSQKTNLSVKDQRHVISLIRKKLLPLKYPRIYHYFYYLPKKLINKFRKLLRPAT